MAGNNAPIFSRVGDIQGGVTLATSATFADFLGTDTTATSVIFISDPSNGGFVQRLRFKAVGTNAATVARVWINNGSLNQVTTLTPPTWGAITPSASGGTLATQPLYAKVQVYDQFGAWTAVSTETAATSITGPTGSVSWTWTAITGAAGYRLFIGPKPGGEYAYFNTTTNSYTQTVPYIAGQIEQPIENVTNNTFYGEISLPATTFVGNAATAEIDYPMNVALPPGYRVLAGLGLGIVSGWMVTAIGGKY